jgi:hypothetical protein
MNDIVVTHIWMAGVMLIMLAYGAFAVVGYFRRTNQTNTPDSQ